MAEHGTAPDEQERLSYLCCFREASSSQAAQLADRVSAGLVCWGGGGRQNAANLLTTASCQPDTLIPACSAFSELCCWKLGHGDQLDAVQRTILVHY